MKAFVYQQTGGLTLQERPTPSIDENGALIRVLATAICGTDLRTFRSGSSKITPPRIVGHEVVGEIVAIGQAVREFVVGDRVQIAPAIGCGKCRSCKRGWTNLCDNLQTIGFQFDGSFAEFMGVPPAAFSMGHVTKVEPGIPDDLAVLAEPIACVENAQQQLGIAENDTIAVFGSGFIGCLHAQLAWNKGAAKVFLIELNRERAQFAKSVLPDLVVIDPERVVEQVMTETRGQGVEVAITACSSGVAQSDALAISAKRARISLFGGLAPGVPSSGHIDSNVVHYREISVHGAHASTAQQNRAMLALISSGKLKVEAFAKSVYPLTDIVEAFDDLIAERIVKAIIHPGACA